MKNMCVARLVILPLVIFLLEIVFSSCGKKQIERAPVVQPGIEVLAEGEGLMLKGKSVGLITNPTGVTSALRSNIEVLMALPAVKLNALFGPEHGVRGDMDAGAFVAHTTDEKTGLPMYSLYGSARKPTASMLKDLDVLVYDIQDVGVRVYSYLYTMTAAMEAAANFGIQFVVLDRPNPLGGELVEGPVLEAGFESSMGKYPIPYVYGLTIGELAQLCNEEFGIQCNLTVVPMQGWRRKMQWEETGLPWVPTSPHIPDAETVLYYASTGCIGELRTVFEGVGYTLPFEIIGARWIDGEELENSLNSCGLPGVYFRSLFVRPYYSSFKGQSIKGVQLHVRDRNSFQPMSTQIHIITALQRLYPEIGIFGTKRDRNFDLAMGTDKVRLAIELGTSAGEIIASWEEEVDKFLKLRKKYLLYE